MKPKTARMLRALFFIYVAFTIFHIAYVVYHEPFAFDAWNVAIDTHARPPSIERFFEFWYQQYTSSNPRIGQPMAYLAYKTVGFAEVGTPLAFLAILIGGYAFGTGRLPRLSENKDLAVLTIGIGILWIVSTNFPAYMFCRAYATNYMYLAAVQLWFLVVLRLLDPGAPPSPFKLAGYFLLGVVAGMGNEHVGPTLLLFIVGYGVWLWRKHGKKPLLVWIGALGVFVGYALIFFAPGQSQRYEGLADRYTLLEQVLVRGVRANVDIYLDMLEAAAPMLAIMMLAIAIGMTTERRTDLELEEARDRQRSAVGIVMWCLIAGSLITITVFASPKLGPRFYIHSMILLFGGVLGVLAAYLHRAKSFAPFVIAAVISSGVAAARTIPMYTRLAHDSDVRLAGLAATPVGGDYTTQAWEQVVEVWWFLGDDMRDQKKQELVTKYFGLHRALFRGGDQWKILGVSDVKTTWHYEFENPMCMDELDDLDIRPFIGRDIRALHHAFLDAIVEIERFGKLLEISLTVSFTGSKPPMPSKTLYIAKWKAGVFEGYSARLRRSGRSKTREIVLDDKLEASPWDIYHVIIGEPPKLLGKSTEGKKLTYVPSGAGQYWTLACQPDYCFVILAVAHTL
jgi:hypothetical protein